MNVCCWKGDLLQMCRRVFACLLIIMILHVLYVATITVCVHADCIKILHSALLWHNASSLIESYHHYIP